MARIGSLILVVALVTLLASETVFSKVQMQNFALLTKPVSVTWAGSAFIASSRDGATRLVKVGTDGAVQPFAASFSGQGEVYVAISGGKAGFPDGQLFLCSGDSIYEMDQAGGSATSFSTPSKGTTINYIAFDTTGAWGFLLYALDASGQLWAIDSTGRATLVTSLGSNLTPEGIAIAPSTFGSFSGDMIVSLESSHGVVALSKGSPGTVTTLVNFSGEAPERVLLIPDGSDLFVAKYDQGVIVRIAARAFANYAGSLLVITEGEAGQTGSLSVLKAVGSNVTVTPLFQDSTSPHFEGAAFVPAELIPTVNSTTSGVTTSSSQTVSTYTALALFAIAGGIIVVFALIVIRRRK